MLNPVCTCGELMTGEAPGELMWDYLPIAGCSEAIRSLCCWSDEGLGVFRLRILDPLEGNRSGAEGGSP